MSIRGRQVNVRVDVPEPFVEAARWILEQLLRQGGCVAIFNSGGRPDIVYSEADQGEAALHLPADVGVINRLLCGHRFNELDFSKAETPFGSVPVFRSDVTSAGDLVATAFYFLSGFDEHVTTRKDRHGRYAYEGSIHERLGTASTPVVDWIAAELRPRLRKAGIAAEEPRSWYVCPTVDVDYLRKWRPGIIFRELVEKPWSGRGEAGERYKRLRQSMVQMFGERGVYRQSLEHIAGGVEDRGGQATIFVKTGARDPYDVNYSTKGYLQQTAGELEKAGHQVGLHPSYWVSSNSELLSDEVEAFASAFGHHPRVSRMHYLRWNEEMASSLQSGGFAIDSTLGFADQVGFRRGTCHPFSLFDLKSWSRVQLVEVPLLVMDSVLFNRLRYTPDEAVAATLKVVETCRTVGGCAVLLWHNIILDEVDHPGWAQHFSDVMAGVDSSAQIVTLDRVTQRILA